MAMRLHAVCGCFLIPQQGAVFATEIDGSQTLKFYLVFYRKSLLTPFLEPCKLRWLLSISFLS